MTSSEKIFSNLVAEKSEQYIAERKKSREYKRHLRALTEAVSVALAVLDREMQNPASAERGCRVTKICNALNFQNDIARRFGLSIRN